MSDVEACARVAVGSGSCFSRHRGDCSSNTQPRENAIHSPRARNREDDVMSSSRVPPSSREKGTRVPSAACRRYRRARASTGISTMSGDVHVVLFYLGTGSAAVISYDKLGIWPTPRMQTAAVRRPQTDFQPQRKTKYETGTF